MALSSYAIFSNASDVYAYLGLEGDVPETQKTVIEDCINSASEDIEQYLNRNIISRTYTDEAHSVCANPQPDREGRVYYVTPKTLYLRNYPVSAITAIKFDNTAVSDITEGVTTGFFYSATDLANIGCIFYESGWPEGENYIKVTYTAGYSVANVPAMIKRVCRELIIWHYSKTGLGRNTLIFSQAEGSIAPGTGSFRTPEELMNYFEKQLAPYRSING